MTAILRIEDRQGAARAVSLYGGNDFCVEPGSRTQTTLPNGNVEDSMRLFVKLSAAGIRGRVKRLTSMLANDAGVVLGATNPAYLVEATDGEAPRRSLIVSAAIAPIDHAIVRQNLTAGAALYALTLERQPFYESPRTVSKTWTATIGGDNSGTDYLIPKKLEDGDVPARIDTLMVQPKNAARIKTLWFGMKPRYGTQDNDLDTWSPLVRIGSSKATVGGDTVVWDSSDSDYYTDYIGGECLRVDFGDFETWDELDDKWNTRAFIPLSRWNTDVTAAKSWQYVGRYRVLLRWASKVAGAVGIENETNTRYGVRAWTAYSPNGERNTLAPVYPRPAYDGQWNWLELGEISIGGDGWSYAQQLRERLTNYTIGLDVAFLGDDDVNSAGDTLPAFFIDAIYLIPAEHFIRVTVNEEFGAEKRLNVYTSSDGVVTPFVSDASAFTSVTPGTGGGGVSTVAPAPAPAHERVSDYEVVNYGVPHRGGRWIMAADRREQNTQNKGATATVTLQAVPRMRLFGG